LGGVGRDCPARREANNLGGAAALPGLPEYRHEVTLFASGDSDQRETRNERRRGGSLARFDVAENDRFKRSQATMIPEKR
jgi:hypothetical protein